MHSISASESGMQLNHAGREMSAEFTSKMGFRSLAPTSTTVTIDSQRHAKKRVLLAATETMNLVHPNRIVLRPCPAGAFLPAAISRRKSATVHRRWQGKPSTNVARVVSAMMCAMLVLPGTCRSVQK